MIAHQNLAVWFLPPQASSPDLHEHCLPCRSLGQVASRAEHPRCRPCAARKKSCEECSAPTNVSSGRGTFDSSAKREQSGHSVGRMQDNNEDRRGSILSKLVNTGGDGGPWQVEPNAAAFLRPDSAKVSSSSVWVMQETQNDRPTAVPAHMQLPSWIDSGCRRTRTIVTCSSCLTWSTWDDSACPWRATMDKRPPHPRCQLIRLHDRSWIPILAGHHHSLIHVPLSSGIQTLVRAADIATIV